MDLLWGFIEYLQTHPVVGLGLVVLLVGVNHLLNRKSRLSRQLDERLDQLRKERGHYYNGVRPPK